jgi:hypothetical protein
MPEKDTAAHITFEDFTNATLNAVVRAIEAHKASENPLLRNPHIIIGIVWAPQLQIEQQAGTAKRL